MTIATGLHHPPENTGEWLAEASHLRSGIKVVLLLRRRLHLDPVSPVPSSSPVMPISAPARATHPTPLVSLATGVRSHCVRQRPPFLRSLRAR